LPIGIERCAAGYRFVPGVSQYSAAVAAEPGHEIVRARLRTPVPLAEGLEVVWRHLRDLGRPTAAFCACELRSPAPFSEEGFARFNRDYVERLLRARVFDGTTNPVARTNVCPEVDPPAVPVLSAFSYAVPAEAQALATFVIAGSGEAPEGRAAYQPHVVRLGDRTVDGMRDKARWVLGEMERRMGLLGFSWADVTGTHIYTVFDVYPFLEDEFVRRGAAACGLTWHYSRPPVKPLDFEMDARSIRLETVI
jgi:hypothetical protein